jgi:hypothetical protein
VFIDKQRMNEVHEECDFGNMSLKMSRRYSTLHVIVFGNVTRISDVCCNVTLRLLLGSLD